MSWRSLTQWFVQQPFRIQWFFISVFLSCIGLILYTGSSILGNQYNLGVVIGCILLLPVSYTMFGVALFYLRLPLQERVRYVFRLYGDDMGRVIRYHRVSWALICISITLQAGCIVAIIMALGFLK